MAQRTNQHPQQTSNFIEPELSVLAMIRVDQARRRGLDPASVPVRELEAQAERIFDEAGGFWALAGSEP